MAQCDVVEHRVIEHDDVLPHQRKLAAQTGQIPFGQGHAIEANAAFAAFHKARQQTGQRGFARTGQTHQRNELARCDVQINVVQCILGGAGVAHTHLLQRHLAPGARHLEAAALLDVDVFHQIDGSLGGHHAPGDGAGDV